MLNWHLDEQSLSLKGILDKQSSMELWNHRNQFTTSKFNILTLDLSALTRIDSAGLATLIALFRELKKHQIGFKIQSANQQTLDLAKVNGVLELLPFNS